MNRLRGALLGLFRAALGLGFICVPRLFFDIEVHGLEHDARAPRTFIAITHKRNMDSIAPVPRVVAHHAGWRGLMAGRVHFVMRADAFSPGFLARLFQRPRWASRLLGMLRFAWAVRPLGIHLVRGLQRQAEEWLRFWLETEGDGPAGEILSEWLLDEVGRAAGEPAQGLAARRLTELLAWRYHAGLQQVYGPEVFTRAVRRRVEVRAVAAAKAQLRDIAAWLHSDGSLYYAPEGQLSVDGRLSAITSGMHRVLAAAPPDARVLPVAIVYDFMTAGRPRICIDVAPAIERAASLPRRDLDEQLRDAWLRSARFTCTQLASGFLVQKAECGKRAFTTGELAGWLSGKAVSLAAEGRHVDERLLRPRGAQRLAAGYLRFSARRRLVRRVGWGRWALLPLDLTVTAGAGEVGYEDTPLPYAWNELRQMLDIESMHTFIGARTDLHERSAS